MAWISWRRWPDILVDFGSQLYLPWQISEGAMLYRDIYNVPGCLSQLYHGLLFTIFAPSLRVLILSNLLILGLLLVMLYRLFLQIGDRMTATFVCLAVVCGFAFSQHLDVGNYNYIAPYSHEVWHGLVMAICMTVLLSRWLANGSSTAFFLGALCYGLSFMTKPEIFFAASSVVIAASVMYALKTRLGDSLRHGVKFVLSACLPVAVFYIYFAAKTDPKSAGLSIVWAWLPVFTTNIAQHNFFRHWMGFDAPWSHVRPMLFYFVGLLAIIVILAWRLQAAVSRIERLTLFCGVAAVSVFFNWRDCGHVLPLVLCSAAVFLGFRGRAFHETRGEQSLPWLWIVLGLALLAKMGFYPRIYHYGVFLAMPAFVGCVYFLIFLLPSLMKPAAAVYFRGAMALLLLIGFVQFIGLSWLFYQDKTFPVGPQQDTIITYKADTEPAGPALEEATEWLTANTRPGDTLGVLPEGALLNFWSRRRNPTGFLHPGFPGARPSVIWPFNDDALFEAYRQHPPEYVALVHRDGSEWGGAYFGQKKGYGLELMHWIRENYELARLIGAEPLVKDAFGIKILRRKVEPPASP